MEEKIKPIYEELKGLCSALPTPSHPDEVSYNIGQIDYFRDILKKAEETLKEDLSRFNINTLRQGIGPHFAINEYKVKALGLLMFLRSYLTDEPEPFKGSPQTEVKQTQTQTQTINQNRIYYIAIGISITVSVVISFALYLIFKL